MDLQVAQWPVQVAAIRARSSDHSDLSLFGHDDQPQVQNVLHPAMRWDGIPERDVRCTTALHAVGCFDRNAKTVRHIHSCQFHFEQQFGDVNSIV